MIVNHKYKFIFLKTRKTAGTSIEICLSEFCDPGDILTPEAVEDESIRRDLGFLGPRNFDIPFQRYRAWDWIRFLVTRRKRIFSEHATARQAQQYLGDEIWNNYFKFCFERNPYDKAISRYYWSTRKAAMRPNMTEYLSSAPQSFLSNWDIYAIDNRIVADFVGRYEHLDEDLAEVTKKIGLPSQLVLPRAKGEHRKDKRPYQDVLSGADRAIVERVCARELAAFKYQY